MAKLDDIIQFAYNTGEGSEFSYILKCPVCGFEFVHPISVRVTREKETTEVTSDGIFIRDTENPGRGVIIEVEYVCENGHHGVIFLTFHEGSTYIDHKKLQPLKHDEWFTIWRD